MKPINVLSAICAAVAFTSVAWTSSISFAQCRGGQGGGQTGTGIQFPGQPFGQIGGQTGGPTPGQLMQQGAVQMYLQQGIYNAQANARRRAITREQHIRVYSERREEMLAARERRRQALRENDQL